MGEDKDRLHALAWGTLIYAGLAAFVALALLAFYFVVALTAAAGGDGASLFAGGLVFVIGAILSAFFFVKAFLFFLSAIGLFNAKWRGFSFVMAGFACTNAPLGTVLGVFTFMILDKPGVRALYEGRAVVATPPPPKPAYAPPPPKRDITPPFSRVRVAT